MPNKRAGDKVHLHWWALAARADEAKAEAEERDVSLTVVLDEALAEHLDRRKGREAPERG